MTEKMKKEYEKFIEMFLKENEIKEIKTYQNLFTKLNDVEKFIIDWDNNDLDHYIALLGSISVSTIDKYLQYIKNFYRFVCAKENIEAKPLYLTYDKKRYLNKEKLSSMILVENQYTNLKNSLTYFIDDEEFNTRDKLLMELAWEGLTSDEIKNLEKDNVVITERFDKKIAELKIKDRILKVNNKDIIIKGRTVIIDNEEIIDDIKKVKNQNEYYIEATANRKERKAPLRDTPYLIRGVQTNSGRYLTVSNPSQLLRKAFEKLYDYYPDKDINLEYLTLESIRRSRAIDLFKKGMSLEDVSEFLGKQATCDLYWIQELGDNIRKQEIKNEKKGVEK